MASLSRPRAWASWLPLLALAACASNPPAQTGVKAAQRFICTGSDGFTLSFRGETATLTTEQGSARLAQQPVGSGFAYAGEGQSIRGKGMELTWTRADGSSLSCREEQWAMRQPQIQPPMPAITGTSWTLVAFQSSDDAIGRKVPPNVDRYTIRFAEDGSLALQLDCNRALGRYTVTAQSEAGGALEIKGGAMTRAMCGPGAMDSEIARNLQHIRSYTLKGDRLFLALMADGGIYEFRRN
jgi:heat shock protein HslJ